MISRIDHVSIAVSDYEKARDFFTNVLRAEFERDPHGPIVPLDFSKS